MNFDKYDNIIFTDKNGKTQEISLIDNMDILEDALEQVVPGHLENIRNIYEKELDKAQTIEAQNDANYGYEQSLKELLQNNWNKVYAIAKSDLLCS